MRLNDAGKFEFNQNLADNGPMFWSTAMDAAGEGMQPIFDLDDWTDSRVDSEKLSELSERRKY